MPKLSQKRKSKSPVKRRMRKSKSLKGGFIRGGTQDPRRKTKSKKTRSKKRGIKINKKIWLNNFMDSTKKKKC